MGREVIDTRTKEDVGERFTHVTAGTENGEAIRTQYKVVGATGEYLVAAELSRRGLIATTFTGNVPHYDIIASNAEGQHVSVQVKAGRAASWQFGDVTQFCGITFDGKRQIVGEAKPCPVRRLVMVFVKIEENGNDQFYILKWQRLRDLLIKQHKAFLDKHGGVRPQRWDSLHCGIREQALRPYLNKWGIIEKRLK